MNRPRYSHRASGKWQCEEGRALEMLQGGRAGRDGEGKKRRWRKRGRRRGERSPWKDVGVGVAASQPWQKQAAGPRAFEFKDLSSFLVPGQDRYDEKWTVQINPNGKLWAV